MDHLGLSQVLMLINFLGKSFEVRCGDAAHNLSTQEAETEGPEQDCLREREGRRGKETEGHRSTMSCVAQT